MEEKSIYWHLILIIITLTACSHVKMTNHDAVSGATNTKTHTGNSLYHNSESVNLSSGTLVVEGEIEHPGKIDFSKIYEREVVVKETYYSNNQPEFIGAYRYTGYSLFDVLNTYTLAKKNSSIFRPEIDLYIKIENAAGESVVFSWSEIFHTINPHQIIIATSCAPIKPHRKDVNYPISNSWKLVAANDLYSFRNLENPTKIIVYSFDKMNYIIQRDLNPLYSPELIVTINGNSPIKIEQPVSDSRIISYNSTFYGMGMGYHPIPEFKGILLKDAVKQSINITDGSLIKNGLVCFASVDGYRAIFSYSELFNRADQSHPILSIVENPNDGGYFRIFLPTDFYADRSVKGLKEIFIFQEN